VKPVEAVACRERERRQSCLMATCDMSIDFFRHSDIQQIFPTTSFRLHAFLPSSLPPFAKDLLQILRRHVAESGHVAVMSV